MERSEIRGRSCHALERSCGLCSPDGAKRNPGAVVPRVGAAPHYAALHAGYAVEDSVARMERSEIRVRSCHALERSRIALRSMRATEGYGRRSRLLFGRHRMRGNAPAGLPPLLKALDDHEE